MKNKIQDLRDHLFVTIEGLLDKDKPRDIERARAVADVAQVVINSAKVEVDHLRALDALVVRTDGNGTGVISSQPKLTAVK